MSDLTLPCPVCLDEFPVTLTLGLVNGGELDSLGISIAVTKADLLSAYLEHSMETDHHA